MQNSVQKWCHRTAVLSLIALIVLAVTWEMWLAPLRPGGSWLALKALPLLLPLHGLIKRDIYTMQWSSMMILMYFTEGAVRASSDRLPLSATLGMIEVGLVICYFFATVFYLKPYKKAARKLAREAIEKAAK